MNKELKSLFDGLLLSDASYTSRSSVSAGLRIEIHERNSDWLIDVSETMRKHGVDSVVEKVPARNREYLGRVIKSGPHVSLRTLMYRNLRREYDRWYPDGKKAVPCDVSVDPVSIANWYMGDGSLVKNFQKNLRIKFYTNGFSEKDVLLLKSRIETEYGSVGFVSLSRVGQPVLIFSARNALTLVNAIRPHISFSFRYKTDDIKYSIPTCVLCGKETSRMNARYCMACRPIHRKALNHIRYSPGADADRLASDINCSTLCSICGDDFSDRFGTKYCSKCRVHVKRAYKVVKRHLEKTPDFDFIEYVKRRVVEARLGEQQ